MTAGGTCVPPGVVIVTVLTRSRDAASRTVWAGPITCWMAWREDEWHDKPLASASEHSRAVVWGALAVVLLAVAGVLYSFLQ